MSWDNALSQKEDFTKYSNRDYLRVRRNLAEQLFDLVKSHVLEYFVSREPGSGSRWTEITYWSRLTNVAAGLCRVTDAQDTQVHDLRLLRRTRRYTRSIGCTRTLHLQQYLGGEANLSVSKFNRYWQKKRQKNWILRRKLEVWNWRV